MVGLDLYDIDGIAINTGRAYTVRNITAYVKYVVELFKLDKEKITIGIVGAGGSIGLSSFLYLVKLGYKNFILIDLSSKN